VKILLLASGGAIGTILRYYLSGLAYRGSGSVFPWGTLAVNLGGSLVIGFLWGLFETKGMSPQARNFIFIGILGGFTTFSTFALESFNLVRAGEIRIALTNIIVSNLFGLILVFAGFMSARHLNGIIR
jgi:CrcB protein